MKTHETHPGILGSAGIILDNCSYNPHTRAGWPLPNPEVKEVDLVGHAWFMERSVIPYLWREKPPTWDNGEDIQLSYSAQRYGNIKTYCPPHPPDDKSWWGSIKGNALGIDEVASSCPTVKSHGQFFGERDMCVRHALDNGWRTVNNV